MTGGGSGIGAATVAQLRRAEYEVLATGRRSESLKGVAAATGCETFVGDVARVVDNERLRERVERSSVPLVGLVNAAGVNYVGKMCIRDSRGHARAPPVPGRALRADRQRLQASATGFVVGLLGELGLRPPRRHGAYSPRAW